MDYEVLSPHNFLRNPGESVEDYKRRCYSQKSNSELTWDDLTAILNSELDASYSETKYRKEAKKYALQNLVEATTEDTPEENPEEIASAIEDLIRETKIERYKLTEVCTQNNAYIRKMAREQTLKEIAHDFAVQMAKKKFLAEPRKSLHNDCLKNGILLISDWHYGIVINNYFNKFDPEICKERVNTLLEEVIRIGQENKISTLYLVNLSDLICGRIHLTLRLESRNDVISQVMEVSEILAEFITRLSSYFNIVYGDVMDNHSRLEPNKKESMELETLVRIIPWYLKERLITNDRVQFLENEIADDILTFNVFGYNVAAVHGHKDKPGRIIDNMTNMTGRKNDLVLSAHYHHMALEEESCCIRISNGTLMGVDTHAQDLRLTSIPSQTLIISTPNNITSAIYKINLQ